MSSNMSYWQRIAGGVRAEMARQRKDANQLMEVLHLSRNSVYRRMNGDVPFNLNEIATVSEWLNVPISAFEFDPRESRIAA
ncbi:hypothetical protein G7068_03160 [Leucobacter viscericola]|uniref:Transcription regulator BetR N-terminal domain-containing protein n=1 Tax=Leucobacter viscericola TaxID=2714935 RepID=A0A6G7XCM7_9MICO|nr:helix-turn-helix domain-containing protein [Leucobacter viscericola]QIK62313.1 hypothetical protein G7068_03160 [Leucobacter viscericola]